jgi:thiosulfate/3-mercaptopyruvate sulfurtransferase
MTRSPLVGAEALAAELDGAAPPLLLDVRWRLGAGSLRDDYLAGHLPGAVWVDLDTDLAAPPGAGGRHPLPSPDAAQDALRRLGVSGSRGVVAYDDTDGSVAARAWWLLRWLGHPDVRLLDGGLRSWIEAGLRLQTGEVRPAAGDLTVRPGGMPVLDADASGRLARDGVLLDVRAGERYRGQVEPVDPVAGHVPVPAAHPPPGTSGQTAGSWTRPGCGTGSPPSASPVPSPSAPTAAPGWRPRTRCWPSRSRGSTRRCTPGRGRNGSPTRPARSPPARAEGPQQLLPALPRPTSTYRGEFSAVDHQ